MERVRPYVCEDTDHGRARVVGDVHAALIATGVHVLAAPDTWRHLGCDQQRWRRFAAHWDELGPDGYAEGAGTSRLRRYGRFVLHRDGRWHALPHAQFRQPAGTNRLFPDTGRDFEYLTAAFVADPVFAALLPLLGEIAAGLDDTPEWLVHVHPFRVIGSDGSRGDATPEGRHQDGVTLVSSLLVARYNATGGRSSVFDLDGREILGVTLSEPGTMLVGDDRRTWHSVSPIRPSARTAPSVRDVLVVTLTGRGELSRLRIGARGTLPS